MASQEYGAVLAQDENETVNTPKKSSPSFGLLSLLEIVLAVVMIGMGLSYGQDCNNGGHRLPGHRRGHPALCQSPASRHPRNSLSRPLGWKDLQSRGLWSQSSCLDRHHHSRLQHQCCSLGRWGICHDNFQFDRDPLWCLEPMTPGQMKF